MKKISTFTFYVLYFAAAAGFLPFLVLFYQSLGFSGTQIGLLTGIAPLITLVSSPFWTGLADAKRWHRFVMGGGIALAIVVVFLLQRSTAFLPVFALIIAFNIVLTPVMPLADSATMSMLGEQRAMYGRIRLGGTFGWGLFAPIAGFLAQKYGLQAAFSSFCVLMLLNLFFSQKFVHGSQEHVPAEHGGVSTLLRNRRWINFLFLAFLGGMASFSVVSYLFPYMAELGANESTMGIAVSVAILTEVPIFFFGNRLVKKFGSYGLLVLALAMAGVRSLLFGAADTPALVLLVQAFGGMIFPAMWLAGVSYAHENAPSGLKSSAQGLFAAMIFGVGSAVGGFLGGLLLESIGGRGMYIVLGIVILTGLILAESIRRLFPDREHLPQVVAVSDK